MNKKSHKEIPEDEEEIVWEPLDATEAEEFFGKSWRDDLDDF